MDQCVAFVEKFDAAKPAAMNNSVGSDATDGQRMRR